YNFALMFAGLQATGLFIIIFLTYSFNSTLNARSRAEKKLKHAADVINDLYENAPCGYLSFNEKGLITAINQTLLDWLQFAREEVANILPVNSILSDCSVPFFANDFQLLKNEKHINDIECVMIRKDQSTADIIINLSVDTDGSELSVRCSLFDNVKRKRA